MDFEYCWTYKNCSKECTVRERKIPFCWRIIGGDSDTPRYCDACSYRHKWVSREYTVEAFVRDYNRRSSPRRGKLVLIVNDDSSVLYALEETVRHLGYDCISACDGEDGLVMARGLRPDLLITDVMLPKLDGFQLITRLREKSGYRSLPVIVITARAPGTLPEAEAESAAVHFISKPFRPADLANTILRFLDPVRARKHSPQIWSRVSP